MAPPAETRARAEPRGQDRLLPQGRGMVVVHDGVIWELAAIN
jgi:hypothetical protein